MEMHREIIARTMFSEMSMVNGLLMTRILRMR